MVGCVQVGGSHHDVVGGRVVLGEVVGKVACSRGPPDFKLALLDLVSNPVEPDAHCLGPLGFAPGVCKPSAVELSVMIGVGPDWGVPVLQGGA
jgi:hypothetical protein